MELSLCNNEELLDLHKKYSMRLMERLSPKMVNQLKMQLNDIQKEILKRMGA